MNLNLLSPSPARRRRAAFSLIEFLVGSGLGLVAMTTLAALSLFTSRSFVGIGNYNDLERHSSMALDTFSREIRGAREVVSYTTNRIEVRNADGQTVVYEFSPGQRRFLQRKGSVTTTLLDGCDFLRINISQRNPSNEFTFHPALTVAQAKLVDVSWRCSRDIMGRALNTESVQTAKIVIRN